MGKYRVTSRLTLCLCLSTGIVPAECGQYAAFITDFGTQLMVLEPSGDLTYSLCNSGSTPVYPTDPTPVLPVSTGPRNGSNIAAVGYYEDDIVYADIFWQDAGFAIRHGRYKCDMDDGKYSLISYESPDSELSSDPDMPDVSIFTGLAAVRIASDNGTRLFFHDSRSGLIQLEYTSSGDWEYVGKVNPDGHLQGPSVGAAVIEGTEMYTVLPRKDRNLDIASTPDGSSWSIESTPQALTNNDTSGTSTQNFTVDTSEIIFAALEAWDSGIANLGLAIDKDESKYVFYIGSDNGLQYLASIEGTNLGAWSVYQSLDTKYWPLADEADSDFAVASDPSSHEIRIYYMSGGSMTEISRMGKDTWEEASALPTKVTTTKSEASATAASASDRSSSSSGAEPLATTTATSSSESKDEGLSTAAAVGVGVAATLGVLIMAGVAGGCYWRRRTRSWKNQHAQDEVALSPQPAGASPYYSHLDGRLQKYEQFTGAEDGPGFTDNQGIAKTMTTGNVDRPSSHEPTKPIPSIEEITTSPPANIVYVPAYELPTNSEHLSSTPELSGTLVATSVPSELQSREPSVLRSIYNQSRPGTVFSTNMDASMPGAWGRSNADANGSMSVSHGLTSPLSELGSDASSSYPAYRAERHHHS